MTPRLKCPFKNCRSRDGVALVLVLAILSVMVILAVAFVASMRLERLAVSSQSDMTRAWALADAALARAIDQIDTDVGVDVVPSWLVTSSSGSGVHFPGLISGVATTYLPRTITMDAAFGTATNSLEWIDITYGNQQGRIAFLIADCSGYLDPNHIGSVSSRGMGVGVGEIRLLGTAAAGSFPYLELINVNFRSSLDTAWRRVESLPELCFLPPTSTGWWKDSGVGVFNVSNYFPYSYFPVGYLDPGSGAQTPLDLGSGTPSESDLETIFSDLNFQEPLALARNLLDYMDEDREPRDLNSFSTESVPMINEVSITNQFTVTPGSGGTLYESSIEVRVELWYPFSLPTPQQYFVEAQVVSIPPVPPLPNGLYPALPNTPEPAQIWTPDQYGVFTFTTPTVSYTDASVPPASSPPALPASLAVRLRVRESPSNVIVDELVIGPESWGDFRFPTVDSPGTSGIRRDADDPRINWTWNDTIHWEDSGTATWGGLNSARVTYANAGRDGDSFMYVANTNPKSIGELGHLLYESTKPWQTIRFLSPDTNETARVLDRFTVGSESKGFVNINTPFASVLAAAFHEAPKSLHPDEVGAATLTGNQAFSVAGRIIGAGPFTNLSDIAAVSENDIRADIGGMGPLGLAQAEAVIRNTIGLLRARQGLFTIVFAGQAVTAGGSQVLAERRGVAVVWRDPYPDPDPDAAGIDQSFVQFFKWLDD